MFNVAAISRCVRPASAAAAMAPARAGASQGLIFYHFGTVSDLLAAASNASVDRSIGSYRTALDGAQSLTDLLAIADELHRRENDNGNVIFMAQMMVGAQDDPVLSDGSTGALTALRSLDRIITMLDELGPIARRAVRAATHRHR